MADATRRPHRWRASAFTRSGSPQTVRSVAGVPVPAAIRRRSEVRHSVSPVCSAPRLPAAITARRPVVDLPSTHSSAGQDDRTDEQDVASPEPGCGRRRTQPVDKQLEEGARHRSGSVLPSGWSSTPRL